REKYDRLIAAAQKEATIKVAVAHPCDDVSLRGAMEAKSLGLIEPVLVGPVERIRGVASQAGLDIGAVDITPSEHSHDSAAKAVQLVTAGKVEALMKGSLHTDELMGAVVSRGSGIRTARRISHCFVMDVPGHADALIITDAAVNIAPSLDEKVDIVQNAIDLAHAIGFPEVRVAILSAMETVTSRRPRPSRPPPCARWRSAARSPARCWTALSRSTTPSARRPRRSRRSPRRSRVAPTCWWFPTSRPATCWRRASLSSRAPKRRASSSA